MDAIKERFGDQFVKAYSFIGQNQIEVKKDRIVEIMAFLRDNDIVPFNYLADETALPNINLLHLSSSVSV